MMAVNQAGDGNGPTDNDDQEHWETYHYGPEDDEEFPSATTWSREDLLKEIDRYRSLLSDIVLELTAQGISLPEQPDWQEAFNAAHATGTEVAPLFFRLGMIMSGIDHMGDLLLRVNVNAAASAAGNRTVSEAAQHRHRLIREHLVTLLAEEPDANDLSVSQLAKHISKLFPEGQKGFSHDNVRAVLGKLEAEIISLAQEQPLSVIRNRDERVRAIAAAKKDEPGYSVETIRRFLR
jgi:hypothetical protein